MYIHPELLKISVFFCIREVFINAKLVISMKKAIKKNRKFSYFFSSETDLINKNSTKTGKHNSI
ncbi:Uncharacterised protein [Bacteroides thetaiotaomicron]|uniref:Uncharacterized protein n=1 Tax=Bacteroides thetaiotaomicron TaxID=818 RepID=A0A174N344_BACT4|nr:Uncharacterised protein [Bacteroides thetaiotaomicron]